MVGLPKITKWQRCRSKGMSSLFHYTYHTLKWSRWVSGCSPTRKAGWDLGCPVPATSSSTSEYQARSTCLVDACWLNELGNRTWRLLPILLASSSWNLSEFHLNPFTLPCGLQQATEHCLAPGRKGTEEKNFWMNFYERSFHTYPRARGEKLSPICSAFSASISSGSRECKSASEAKLKRTTLWPVLSGLQISQA